MVIASGPSAVVALDKTPTGVILVTLSSAKIATYKFPDKSIAISSGVTVKEYGFVDTPSGVILLIFFEFWFTV